MSAENLEMFVAVLSPHCLRQLTGKMEGMTERMEVLETEYRRMGKEIETLKQEKEIAQYEKPRTLNIRSELWNLFLIA